MEIRNLPIKIFGTRGPEDLGRVEGGGSRDAPSWVLDGPELVAKAESLRDQVRELRASDREDDLDVPIVAQVTIKKEAIAKSHRTKIGELFSESGRASESLMGMEGDLDLLVALDGERAVSRAAARLESAERYRVGVSAVDEVTPFEPSIEVPEDGETALKVKLHRFGRPDVDARVRRAFERRLERAEVEFERRQYAFDLDVYRVAAGGADAVRGFAALHSLAPMPTATLGVEVGEPLDVSVPRTEPVEGEAYVTVGVLDSGIARTPHLQPWLDERAFSPYPEEDLDRSHGTATASVLLYGDELSGQAWVGAEKFRLLDAAVFHKDVGKMGAGGMDEDELIENVQRAIEAFPDVRVWVFSGGGTDECDEQEFSDFAKVLDDLQARFEVVIFTSAGNCGRFMRGYAPGRVAVSGDSLLAMTVGSATHERPDERYVEVDHRSPFSPVGPGPARVVKPEVVHYGGNAAIGKGSRPVYAGVPVMTPAGGVALTQGTSFSAPRVAALAAGLAQTMEGEPSPLLLKALVLHSAQYGPALTLDGASRIQELGYGVPRSVEDVLYNAPFESTLVMEDRLEKGDFIELFDFPFPPDLVDGQGYYRGEILVTLVSTPRLATREGAEYCQSDIDVQLGTYDRVSPRDVTRPTILNAWKREEAINVLLKAKYTTAASRQNAAFTRERVLRDNRLKYHPAKKYAVSLSEMTEGNRAKHLKAPRPWFLKLRGLYKSAAEAAADRDGEQLFQDFCLIVTVRDPLGQAAVYDQVARQLAARAFPHQDVRVEAGVRVRVI